MVWNGVVWYGLIECAVHPSCAVCTPSVRPKLHALPTAAGHGTRCGRVQGFGSLELRNAVRRVVQRDARVDRRFSLQLTGLLENRQIRKLNNQPVTGRTDLLVRAVRDDWHHGHAAVFGARLVGPLGLIGTADELRNA